MLFPYACRAAVSQLYHYSLTTQHTKITSKSSLLSNVVQVRSALTPLGKFIGCLWGAHG